jgi:hypothetical protein
LESQTHPIMAAVVPVPIARGDADERATHPRDDIGSLPMWILYADSQPRSAGLDADIASANHGRMKRTLRCRLGWHHWRLAFTPDNEKYLVCSRCGKEGEPGIKANMLS